MSKADVEELHVLHCPWCDIEYTVSPDRRVMKCDVCSRAIKDVDLKEREYALIPRILDVINKAAKPVGERYVINELREHCSPRFICSVTEKPICKNRKIADDPFEEAVLRVLDHLKVHGIVEVYDHYYEGWVEVRDALRIRGDEQENEPSPAYTAIMGVIIGTIFGALMYHLFWGMA